MFAAWVVVVWCGVVWCDVVWCGVLCGVVAVCHRRGHVFFVVEGTEAGRREVRLRAKPSLDHVISKSLPSATSLPILE